ncbi:MAG: hypothetical protein ABGW81_08715, partial [Paracoccaceae bacterium]
MFKHTEIFRDNRETAADGNMGDLPEWDLDDLYSSTDGPEIAADLKWLGDEGPTFGADYQGNLDKLDAAAMLECVLRYERIQQVAGRVMSYAGLLYYQNTTDADRGKFMADMQAQITNMSANLVFFSLEVNRIEDDDLAGLLAENSDLNRYKPVFDSIRKMKPYQLSDELEKFLHDQSVVGISAWNRLFDETMAALTFDVDGEEQTLEATLNLLSDTDRARREVGVRALVKVFSANTPLFARITNTLAKEKEIKDKWRELPTPQMSRHLANDVEPEVVQALRDAVVAAYPKLSHRYYALKAKWLGLDKMEVWDRNAPLPGEDDLVIPWDQARSMVMDAYADFDPRMAELAALMPGKIMPDTSRLLLCPMPGLIVSVAVEEGEEVFAGQT